ncbi:ATP-binding protein [Ferrimonas pelagia]
MRRLTAKLFSAIATVFLVLVLLVGFWITEHHFVAKQRELALLFEMQAGTLLVAGDEPRMEQEAISSLLAQHTDVNYGVFTLGGLKHAFRYRRTEQTPACSPVWQQLPYDPIAQCMVTEGDLRVGDLRLYYSLSHDVSQFFQDLMVRSGVVLLFLFAGFGCIYLYAAQLFLYPLTRVLRELSQMGTGKAKFVTRKTERSDLSELAEILQKTDVELYQRQQSDEELNGRLRKALLARSEFMANASHEIRTPINSIIGFVDVLEKEQAQFPEGLKEHLSHISSASYALLHIVDEVLDFSKLDSSKLELEPVNFALKDAIRQRVSSFSGQAISSNVTLLHDLADDLPEFALGDEGRMGQIINNLVSNAVKFSPNGKVTVSARCLRHDSEGFLLELKVKDNGIGMERNVISSIFDAYSQADTSVTRRFGGTGLGLAISKKLADLMSARLEVESEPEKGSTFSLILPLKQGKTIIEPAPVKVESATVGLLSGRRVMLVEDNKSNQALMKVFLAKLGAEKPAICNNGLEAVEQADARRYDVILMDCQMPVMDGFTASQKIRSGLSQHALIVAITANVTAQDEKMCREAGMDDFLTKPLTLGALESGLKRMLVTNVSG